MRITSAQETYLRRLMAEAFSHLYDYTAVCGRIESNRLHVLTSDEASRTIQHLIDAKARGWTPWAETPVGRAKAAADAQRSVSTRARVAVLRMLKEQGYRCNCAEQRLENEHADESLCPLHSRFNVELARSVYREVAAKLRATGERGSEHAALLVEQLADEVDSDGALNPMVSDGNRPALARKCCP